MKFSSICLIAATLFVSASCSTVRHTADVLPVETKVVNFTVADLKVSPEKKSRTTSWNFNLFSRVSVPTVKENTEALLLDEVGGDVLLEPQYIINKRGFLRGGSVTVTGYPAKYTNFHKMTPDEAVIVKNACEAKKDKPRKRWFFF